MNRMKVTVVGYYVAEAEHYDGETDPVKMAAIDAENVDGNGMEAVYMMDEGLPITITVEPAA